MSARLAALAGRARLTEGQLYSCVITLGMAALLATGLGNVHGVAGLALAQPPLSLPPAVVPAPVVVPEPATPPLAGLPLPAAPGGVGLPVPAPEPAPRPEPHQPDAPGPAPSPSPTPSAPPCDSQAVQDAGTTVVTTLNGASGGRLPEKDLLAALGTITGCDPSDPAVLAIGLLVGAGHTLPDLDLPAPPSLPFVEVPDGVVAALQPVRPQVDTVCGLVGTGNTVAALFIWAYPTPVPQATAQLMFQALAACGQVRQ